MSYTTHAYRLKEFLNQIPTRLVDFVNLGDSNMLKDSAGWDTGVASMIFEYLNNWSWGPSSPSAMYATGLHSFGEGSGTTADGSGMGWGLGADGATSQTIRHLSDGGCRVGGFIGDEAPFAISGFWHSAGDPGPTGAPSNKNHMREVWWQSTTVPNTNPASTIGLMIQPQNPLGIGKTTNGALQYQLWAAKWTAADAPSLGNQTFYRLRHPGGSGSGALMGGVGGIFSFVTHGAASSGVDTEAPFTIDIPVDGARADDDGISVRWNGSDTSAAVYPFAGFFQRFVRTNATWGFSVSDLYATGGADVWDCMNYVTNVQGNTCIRNYLKCVTKHQRSKSQAPMVVFPIMFGMNDWGGTPMPEASHKTYMIQLIDALRTAWIDNGYDPDNILFALVPSHMPDSGDSIIPYRRACAQIARQYRDVCCLDLSDITSYTTLNTNTGTASPGFYSAGDKYHLWTSTTANNSYRALGVLLSGVVETAPRPSTYKPRAAATVLKTVFDGWI